MIYTASYFEPQNWHGTPYAISRSIPANLKGVNGNHPLRWLLAPSDRLLDWWKRQESRYQENGWQFPDEQATGQYTAQYWDELKPNADKIKAYLASEAAREDQTWLCWEKSGEFCHRNLAALIVQKHQPDLFGGADKLVKTPSDDADYLQSSQPAPQSQTATADTISVDAPIAACRFAIGDRVRLKHGYGEYRVIGIREPESDKPWALPDTLIELEGEGGNAFWFAKQLEAACDSIP